MIGSPCQLRINDPRLVQRTLTGETAETTCHCGKVCKNLRGLLIHQSRTQCGQAGKHIQRTIVTTVGETAENFNQDQHHSIEALSETENMHASTMNSDNHTRSSNRDESPDPLLELLSSPIDSSTSVTNGGASSTTAQRTICTKIRRSNGPVPSPPKNGRNLTRTSTTC